MSQKVLKLVLFMSAFILSYSQGKKLVEFLNEILPFRLAVPSTWKLLPNHIMRNDKAGHGHYGARRGKGKHQGLDLVVTPGEDVISPIGGRIINISYPYQDLTYQGVDIQANGGEVVRVWYINPTVKPGQFIAQGQKIGEAADITKRYNNPHMLPHIHVEVKVNGLNVDPQKYITL